MIDKKEVMQVSRVAPVQQQELDPQDPHGRRRPTDSCELSFDLHMYSAVHTHTDRERQTDVYIETETETDTYTYTCTHTLGGETDRKTGIHRKRDRHTHIQ